MTDLLKGWGVRDVTAVTTGTLWDESRNVCECDVTPVWNDLIQKFPGGFLSGKDSEWTQSTLRYLWYESRWWDRYSECGGTHNTIDQCVCLEGGMMIFLFLLLHGKTRGVREDLYMSIGVMEEPKLRDLHDSDTLGCTRDWNT